MVTAVRRVEVMEGGSQISAESATTVSDTPVVPRRVTDDDGHILEVFPVSTDEATLERLLRELFESHWDKIVFGPIIQGAAWEFQAPHAPTHVGVLDGYLTVAFGAPHFHLCIGPTRGARHNPTPPELAAHRRCARAEFYRRFSVDGTPSSWGLRMYNGHGEQQATIVLPNPFLSPDGKKVLNPPDWSQLELWDDLRFRYAGVPGPDPVDRSGKGFRHD
jgi:hypothetical protein